MSEQAESILSAAKRSIENAHAALDKSVMLMPRDKSHQGLTPRIKCLVARAEKAEARVKELEAVLARHAAGSSQSHPNSSEIGMISEPASCPIHGTEQMVKHGDHWSCHGTHPIGTPEQFDAARREVKP